MTSRFDIPSVPLLLNNLFETTLNIVLTRIGLSLKLVFVIFKTFVWAVSLFAGFSTDS